MKFRAFISADIEPSERLIYAIRELSGARADLKVVKPDLLHLTLKFLGDTEEAIVDDIMSKVGEVSSGTQPFKIRLRGMGAFPSMSNIRVVWVGIEDGKELVNMANRLEESLSGLGFPREKKGFVPHLTLARTKSARNLANVQEMLRNNATTDFGEYLVDRILLKKSVLSPIGPTYSTVRERMLGSAP